MHQSGHSRAQSMQEVQFSSCSAITPRLRGGSAGFTSGYSPVWTGRSNARPVVASPDSSPRPSPGEDPAEGDGALTTCILP